MLAAHADMPAIGAFSRPGAGAGAGPARRCVQIWRAAPCAPRRAVCRLKLRRAWGGADGPLCVSGGPLEHCAGQLCALSAARQPKSTILGQKVWVVPGRSRRLRTDCFGDAGADWTPINTASTLEGPSHGDWSLRRFSISYALTTHRIPSGRSRRETADRRLKRVIRLTGSGRITRAKSLN